jgi:hypothetical protein
MKQLAALLALEEFHVFCQSPKTHLNVSPLTKVPTGNGRLSSARTTSSARWNFRNLTALVWPRGFESEFRNVEALMLSTVLIVILILILVGALPTWGYSSGWGYGPGGIVGTILVIVVILALLGRI